MTELVTSPAMPPVETQTPAAVGINPLAMMAQGGNALAAVTSNEKVVETLASIFIAKNFPRNLAQVTANMTAATSRVSLAQKAVYTYPRGGTSVEGPSVHLADALLGAWGNAESGWTEVNRHKDPKKGCMVSECVAYAFDKETNNKHNIAFSVPHWRDTKKGGYPLTDERDIYELCANMAARRRRAAILRVLPAWLVEEALENCNNTLRTADGNVPMADRIRRMEAKFAAIGITKAQLEAKLGHKLEATTINELVTLGKHFNAIEGGHARVDELFEPEAKPVLMAASKPAPMPRKRQTPVQESETEQDTPPEEVYTEEESVEAAAAEQTDDFFGGDNLPGLETAAAEADDKALEKLSKALAPKKRRMADVVLWARRNKMLAPDLSAPRAELARFARWLLTQPGMTQALTDEFGIEL